MAVAVSVHVGKGAMGQTGGYELPLTMVAALALAATGPAGTAWTASSRGASPGGSSCSPWSAPHP